MALNPIRPRLRNISNGVAKVQLIIPPGDVLEVSEEVAAQLAHQQAPLRPDTPPAPEPVAEPKKAPAKKAPGRTRKAAQG